MMKRWIIPVTILGFIILATKKIIDTINKNQDNINIISQNQSNVQKTNKNKAQYKILFIRKKYTIKDRIKMYLLIHVQPKENIYVINADGSGLTRLTNHNGSDFDPDWAPDGSKIVFSSNRDGPRNIYVMNPDGSSTIKLTNNNDYNVTYELPKWSPDGSKILFEISIKEGYKYKDYIGIINSNGTNQKILDDNYNHPEWSPDGSKIVFVKVGNIYIMSSDAKYKNKLTNFPEYISRCSYPRFSPDGNKILFVSDKDDGGENIYVINADGSNLTNLTNFKVLEDIYPHTGAKWSPIPIP